MAAENYRKTGCCSHMTVVHTACSVAVLHTEQNDGCCCVEERFGCTRHHRVPGNTGRKSSIDEDCCNPSSLVERFDAAESLGFVGSLAEIYK